MLVILMHAWAGLRRAKSQTGIVAALLLIASLMLSIGLVVVTGFTRSFDETAEELRTTDMQLTMPAGQFTPEVQARLQPSHGISEQEHVDGLLLATSLEWAGESIANRAVFYDAERPRTLSQWKVIGAALPRAADSIYVPYLFKTLGRYQAGDRLDIELGGHSVRFTIAGFVESIYQDRVYVQDVFFVPAQRFDELSGMFPEDRVAVLFVNSTQPVSTILADVHEIAGSEEAVGVDYAAMKSSRISMSGIIAAVLLAFAAVIVVVCLLVVHFQIVNGIEEDLRRIGSLQAMGYTRRQIAASVAGRYGLIAVGAALVGTIGAYLPLPVVSAMLAQQSGYAWSPGFAPLINLAALTFIVIAVEFVAVGAMRRVRRMSAVQALRRGMRSHDFTRNHAPLETSPLPLAAAWAWKSIAQNVRQAALLALVMTATAFTAAIALSLYYNAAINTSAFEKVPGIERANVMIAFGPGQDTMALRDEVQALKQVRKAQFLDPTSVTVNDVGATAWVMEDHSGRETVTVYEGRYPEHDNEITLSGALSALLGIGIGGEVRLAPGERQYLVTGLTQGMGEGSLAVNLTTAGVRHVQPGFEPVQLMLYLDDGTDAAVFVKTLQQAFDGRHVAVNDVDAAFAQAIQGFASVISTVGLGIVLLGSFVVILVTYFVISSNVVRQRRALGIQKALGYTTASLMRQVSLGIALPVAVGAACGVMLAAPTLNPLMELAMGSMGIVRSSLLVPWGWLPVAAIAIIVVGYVTSLTVTRRIRRLSAHAAVTE